MRKKPGPHRPLCQQKEVRARRPSGRGRLSRAESRRTRYAPAAEGRRGKSAAAVIFQRHRHAAGRLPPADFSYPPAAPAGNRHEGGASTPASAAAPAPPGLRQAGPVPPRLRPRRSRPATPRRPAGPASRHTGKPAAAPSHQSQHSRRPSTARHRRRQPATSCVCPRTMVLHAMSTGRRRRKSTDKSQV